MPQLTILDAPYDLTHLGCEVEASGRTAREVDATEGEVLAGEVCSVHAAGKVVGPLSVWKL